MFAILLKLTPVFIFALPGVIALALFPGRESKMTFVTLLNELLPTGIRGLVLAALLASLIGSNLSVMNSVSTLVVRDFLLHFRPRSSERAQVFSSGASRSLLPPRSGSWRPTSFTRLRTVCTNTCKPSRFMRSCRSLPLSSSAS